MDDKHWGLLEDYWYGTFMELAIEFKLDVDEKQIEDVRQKIIDSVGFIRGLEYGGVLKLPSHLFGYAKEVAFGISIIDDIPKWLVFFIPSGSISETDSEEEEMDMKLQSTKNLVDWLAQIGLMVYKEVKFNLGLIGEEVSGTTYSSNISRDKIPEIRYRGLLIPNEVGDLIYYPPNPKNDEDDIDVEEE